MKAKYLLGMTLLALASVASCADTTPEMQAKQLCSTCHGTDGNAKSSLFPRLAGQKAPYIATQLREFRGQHRSDQDAHDYMWGMARSLDDKSIDAIADYFSALPHTPNDATSDPALVAKGSKIFKEGLPDKGVSACIACHGEKGEGSYIAPMLAGQHAAYIFKQLNVFTTDQRPVAEAMKAIVKGLSQDEMHALAAYAQSIK